MKSYPTSSVVSTLGLTGDEVAWLNMTSCAIRHWLNK